MRTALFNTFQYLNPVVMPAWEVLCKAIIEGARAIALGNQTGSLEAGKQADVILVDPNTLNLSPVLETPMRNILPNLIYAGSGHEVRLVMLAAKILMRDQKILTADVSAVHAEAQAEAQAIAPKVAADPIHKGLAHFAVTEAGKL